jgi:hypothetical protein
VVPLITQTHKRAAQTPTQTSAQTQNLSDGSVPLAQIFEHAQKYAQTECK